MLWILPINLPTLVVWIHNLAVHWLTPFSSHHNVLSILPFVLLVETLSTGKMVPRITTWIRHLTSVLFFSLALYSAVYGITYAYLLHSIVNIICVWLMIIYFSGSPFTMSGFTDLLETADDTRQHDVKKQPWHASVRGWVEGFGWHFWRPWSAFCKDFTLRWFDRISVSWHMAVSSLSGKEDDTHIYTPRARELGDAKN